jgi:GT2 family glycosyltransferase
VTPPASRTAAGAGDLEVAICICTRDRPAELARALRSVAESTVPAAEIIVADDGNEATTQVLLDEISPSAHWVRGPRVGLGANRNSAVAAAHSRYVLFLDDDAELSREFISTVGDCLSRQSSWVLDRTIVTGRERRNGHLIAPAEQDFLGYQRIPYTCGSPLKTVVINSTIFPRRLFDAIRFDTRLRYGYDEVDITTRAVVAGYMIVDCPEAVNFHQRSELHRSEYHSHAEAARLYVTAKRRLFVERRRAPGAVFLPAASLHMLVHGFRSDGLGGAARAVRAILTGLAALLSYVRRGT